MDDLLDLADQCRVFTPFGVPDFFLHDRQGDHMQMVVVDRVAQLFRQRAVQFISVHDGGENVFRAILLLREAEDLLIKATGVVIAAVFLKVGRVHVENHFIEKLGIRLQSAQGNGSFFDHLIQGRVVGQISAALEMDVPGRLREIHVHVFVVLVLALDMALRFADARLGVLLDAGNGIVFPHSFHLLSFLLCGVGRGLHSFFKVCNPL